MINGKGMFLWLLERSETPKEIAWLAKNAGIGHILIKIADGAEAMPGDIQSVVNALRSEGIQALGWQYIYGAYPTIEARKAVELCQQYDLDGFIVNAEGQFDRVGMDEAARLYMTALRSGLGDDFVIGLSSYRYPAMHEQFPWKSFLERCNLVMPQVYWAMENDPGAPERNLKMTLNQHKTLYSKLRLSLPLVFTGAAYSEHGWTATPIQVEEFMIHVEQMTLSESLVLGACNFWEWWEARSENQNLWEVISRYQWRILPMSDFNIWANAVTVALRGAGHQIPDPPKTTIPAPETFRVQTRGKINLRDKPGGTDIGDVQGVMTIMPPTQRVTLGGNWYTWGKVVEPVECAGWIALENTTRLNE